MYASLALLCTRVVCILVHESFLATEECCAVNPLQIYTSPVLQNSSYSFMFTASIKAERETDCDVKTHLYLMCPDTLKDIILVNHDNVTLCLNLWEKSSVFEFHNAFQNMMKQGIKVTPRASGNVVNGYCVCNFTHCTCVCRDNLCHIAG